MSQFIDKLYCLANQFYRISGAPSAGYLFFCSEDKTIFLTHRAPEMSSPGTWDIPGGRPKDIDQTPLETANREAYEELGTIPKNKYPIGSHTLRNKEHHYIVFLVDLSASEKREFTSKLSLSDESDDYRWFPYETIPDNTHFDLTWCRKILK